MTTTFIYGLIDPRTNQLRYIGKANDIQKRLYAHYKDATCKNTYKSQWLKGLFKENKKPKVIIIEEVPKKCWQKYEKYWIEYYKNKGCKLTNGTNGGDGVIMIGVDNPMFGVTGEKHHWWGKKHSEESKRKVSETRIAKGIKLPDHIVKQTADKLRGRKHTEEHKFKISQGNKGHIVTQETRDKISKSHIGLARDEASKEKQRIKMTGRKASEETRTKMSIAQKNRQAKHA